MIRGAIEHEVCGTHIIRPFRTGNRLTIRYGHLLAAAPTHLEPLLGVQAVETLIPPNLLRQRIA